jgi:hypothetical protein
MHRVFFDHAIKPRFVGRNTDLNNPGEDAVDLKGLFGVFSVHSRQD